MKQLNLLRTTLLTLLVSVLGFGEATAQRAFAVYTESDATLTFKYGNNYMTGQAYQLNTESNDPGWYKDGTCNKVERVVFDASFATVRPTSTFRWFYYMENLEDIEGIKNLNTSEVTNMDWMFSHCRPTIFNNLSLDTRNVTTMRGMFAYCNMKTFSMNIDTRKVTDMSRMFFNCTQLEGADLSYFNINNVTDMSSMFRGCKALKTIYVGNEWDPSNCQQSTDMFENCTSIVGGAGTTYNSNNTDRRFAYVDGGPTAPGYMTLNDLYAVFNTRQKTLTFYHDTDMASRTGTTYYLNRVGGYEAWRADGTNKLVTIAVIDDSFADVRPTNIRYWFNEMENLEYIVGIVENLDISEVTDLSFMFYGCSSLREVDLSYFDTHHITNMDYMFGGCSALTYIFVGEGWNTDKVTTGTNMFLGCTSLVGQKGTAYDQSHVDKDYAHADGVPWGSPGYLILGAPYVESYQGNLRFYYDANRSERTGKTYSLNVKNNDPRWNYDVNMSGLKEWIAIDYSFRDYRPTTTRGWFAGMLYASSISGLQYLNTSAVTDMSGMFSSCMRLSKVDLSNFNTENVTDMSYMFSNCKELTSLNLSDLDTHKVTNMEGMFQDCSALKAIYVGDGWSTDNCQLSNNMFKNCTSLVGAQGTKYDENHLDGAYAHIDGGPDNPGYLTGTAPYAIYYNGTLTFYYDFNVDRRSGTSYLLNSGSTSIPEWYKDNKYKDVKSVVFDPSFADARPTTTSGWFLEMSNLKTITGMKEYLNTSEVTGTTWMFFGCSALESVNVSNFDTEKVDMAISMFQDCSSLKMLDLSSFNTRNVTDMSTMFSGCSNLKTIYVGEGWDLAHLRTSYKMFDGCTSIVGGAGTTYVPGCTDAAYAHVDGGEAYPGYLTMISLLKGDVNADGQVGIGDIVAITNIMAGIETDPFFKDRADVNDDNEVGIGDIVAITNIMAGQ